MKKANEESYQGKVIPPVVSVHLTEEDMACSR